MSSVITMSAPFFLGRIIDVIYTNPTVDYGYTLTRLCLALSGVFLCGAAANTVRVYLMQTSGKRALTLPSEAFQRIRTGAHVGFRVLQAPCSSFPTVPSSGDKAPCLARRGSYEYFSIWRSLLSSPGTWVEGREAACLTGGTARGQEAGVLSLLQGAVEILHAPCLCFPSSGHWGDGVLQPFRDEAWLLTGR